MPTPPLPLPADCRVETLAEWLYDAYWGGACLARSSKSTQRRFVLAARAVRALVESKCVSAVIAYDAMANGDPKLDDVIARVLGGAP